MMSKKFGKICQAGAQRRISSASRRYVGLAHRTMFGSGWDDGGSMFSSSPTTMTTDVVDVVFNRAAVVAAIVNRWSTPCGSA